MTIEPSELFLDRMRGLAATLRTAYCIGLGIALLPGASIAQSPATSYQPADWAKTVAAARKEGKVTLYSAQVPPVVERLVAGFKKAYPDINVEWVRNGSGVLISRADQERTNGLDGADVLVSSESLWLVERAKAGELKKPLGPASRKWPDRYLADGSGGTVPLGGVEPMVIVYNKNMVSTPPRTYADLLKPEYKGRLATAEITATFVIAWYDWLEKTQGEGFLAKLKAQNPKILVLGPATQTVASGELAANAFGNPTSTRPLMETGAPIAFVVPNPALGVVYAMAAFGWSKRPNAALVMLDYLMSEEGQTVWHGRGESASPLAGIPGSLDASIVTPWNPAAYPPDVAKKLRERLGQIF